MGERDRESDAINFNYVNLVQVCINGCYGNNSRLIQFPVATTCSERVAKAMFL